MLFRNDTIFAPSSGVGKAAVSIIRISGKETRNVLEALCGTVPEPKYASLRKLRRIKDGSLLDEALVLFFEGPKSFTGEDVAEFHIHGSLAVKNAVLKELATFPNCRFAERGEFTQRAFRNGRMDLTQVEGLADLIDSETERQREQAFKQMEGRLGHQVSKWRHNLIEIQALIEANLDFSDEEDVEDFDQDSVHAVLVELIEGFRHILQSNSGERIREGFLVVLIGQPNAGKSSLINALSERDVALVSDVPGTTRDSLEVHCDIDGYPITFIDTAGLRETEDFVEQLGIERARQKIKMADVILHLIPPKSDKSILKRFDIEHIGYIDQNDKRLLRVGTKADLISDNLLDNQFEEKYDLSKIADLNSYFLIDEKESLDAVLSIQSKQGLKQLLHSIRSRIEISQDTENDVFITRSRHRIYFEKACEFLTNAITQLEYNGPLELISEDVRSATRVLGSIIGVVDVEEILSEIFSSFCIGK